MTDIWLEDVYDGFGGLLETLPLPNNGLKQWPLI